MQSGKSRRLPSDSLWRNRSFLWYWSGSAISMLGSIITAVVLPILVYRLTGSALQTSLLAALEVIPYLVFGLFAGVLADRVNRKRLMIVCNLTNMLILASIPVAGALRLLTIPQLYLVAILTATTVVWFDAADFGALPTIAGREHIVEANSFLTSTASLLSILGPSVAGVLAALFSPALAISADALSYGACAMAFALIPRTFNALRQQTPTQGSFVRRTLKDMQEGLHFLVHQPLVRTMTLLGFGNSLTGGAVIGLLVVYGVQALGLARNDARIGLLFTAGAVGSLLAGVLLPRLIKRFPVGRLALTSLCLTPLLLVALALTSQFLIGLLVYGLWDACYSLTVINGISLRQMVTPDHLQSRVNTTARMIAWGGTPFGAIVGGVLAQFTTIRIAYLVMAFGVAISAIIGWFSPLRQPITPEPEPEVNVQTRSQAD